MNQPSHDRRTPRIVGIVVVCLVIGVLIYLSLARREPHVSAPKVAEVIDLEATRAKAERGDAEAQKNLGAIHARGESVKQSYAEAAKWYRQAANQGHAGAQAALGELYEAGQGVPCDEAEAARWYRRAADQGHVGGQYSLAVLYVMGKGVARDIAEALKWYRRAADQGNALAQYNLGMRYKEGDGVPSDPIEAFAWLSLASAQGLDDAAKARDELKRRMKREQIAEGQRRARTLAEGKPQPRRSRRRRTRNHGGPSAPPSQGRHHDWLIQRLATQTLAACRFAGREWPTPLCAGSRRYRTGGP